MESHEVNDILAEIRPVPPKKDADLIVRAYDFALKAHSTQKRNSGEPYFIHVFETAKNLARYEMDATTIAAGFLHDVLEDTETTEEELTAEFGSEIVELVKGVNKLGHVKYQGHIRHVESLRKFLMAIAQDYRVLMIKLADRLHNLRTLEHVRPDKQKRIALESIEVYAPLADRLGIGRLKGQIEDAAFPFAYPTESKDTQKLLDGRSKLLKESLQSVYTEIRVELALTNIQVKKIDWRIKHAYSLWKKLAKHKGKEKDTIDTIYDIAAIRIVVETVEECYSVLGLVHSLWKPLPSRIKDFIALPKLNGYQSLHTTIFTGEGGLVEIQIRTLEMHSRAEFGIASHYLYKEKNKEAASDPKFRWVDEFKNLGKTGGEKDGEPEDFISHLKSDFFNDRIFVFTPLGEVIDLPKGSSTIDFAYAIHSDIGSSTSGARINGKFVSLDTELHSSDIVEIETRKDATPKGKWLDHVKTSAAKKHIRAYINEEDDKSILKRFIPRKFK
jgi:guanosine-3',5'-bis(diphosphate) 3'-pyrophosphohydrolase